MKPTKEQYIDQLKLLDAVMEQTGDSTIHLSDAQTNIHLDNRVSNGEVTIYNDEYSDEIDPRVRLLKNAGVSFIAMHEWKSLHNCPLEFFLNFYEDFYVTQTQFAASSPEEQALIKEDSSFIWERDNEETLYFLNTRIDILTRIAKKVEPKFTDKLSLKKTNTSLPKKSEENTAYANYSPILHKLLWFGYASTSLHMALTGLTLLLGVGMGLLQLNPLSLILLVIAPMYLVGARFLWKHRDQNVQSVHDFVFRFIGNLIPGFWKEHKDMVVDSEVVKSNATQQKAIQTSKIEDFYTSDDELEGMINDLTRAQSVKMPSGDTYSFNTDFKRLKSLFYLSSQMSFQDRNHFVTCVTSLHEVYDTIVEVAECGNTSSADFVKESIHSTYVRLEPVFDRIERNAMQPNEDKAIKTDMFLASKFSEMTPAIEMKKKEPKGENTISFFED